MRIALINGSPKGSKSASQVILNFAKGTLPKYIDCVSINLKDANVKKNVLRKIAGCDVLIWAFPLYVDAVPSHVLPWFYELEKYFNDREGPKPRVYALVNCGFYEADQNEIMLEIIKNWCAKSGLIWGQGIGFGAGGVFYGLRNIPLGKWPFKNMEKTLKSFAVNLLAEKSAPDLFVSPNFPRFSYKIVAEFGWRRAIIRNGLKLRDLNRKIAL